MPQTLEEYLNSLPEWHDDVKIAGLFSAFAESRSVNPEVWDARLAFWKKLIIQANKLNLLGPDFLVLKIKDLEKQFERKGMTPIGLSTVVNEMKRGGDLVRLDTYRQTFMSTAVETLVKRPIYWGIRTFLSYDLESPQESLIIASLVAEVASKIIAEHRKSRSDSVDDILTFPEFVRLVQMARSNDDPIGKLDFEILLDYMNHSSLIQIGYANSKIQTDPDNLIIRMKSAAENNSPLTNNCIGIFKIKNSMQKINDQLNELICKMEDLKKETLLHLKRKNRPLAMISLKREKMLQSVQAKRLNSLALLEEVLLKIKSSRMDVDIIDIMKIASVTLGNVIKESSLSPESVNEAFEDLQDQLADHKEIDQAFATGQESLGLTIDDESLEKELAALVAQDEAPRAVPAAAEENTRSIAQPSGPSDVETLISELESITIPDSHPASPPPKETKEMLKQLDSLTEMNMAS